MSESTWAAGAAGYAIGSRAEAKNDLLAACADRDEGAMARSKRGVRMSERHNASRPCMPGDTVRSTVYLEPALHQALRLKAATSHRSVSEIVNDAIRAALREDEEDLAAFAARDRERPLSYEAFLARLKADGTV
jgi:hypothetical protein